MVALTCIAQYFVLFEEIVRKRKDWEKYDAVCAWYAYYAQEYAHHEEG